MFSANFLDASPLPLIVQTLDLGPWACTDLGPWADHWNGPEAQLLTLKRTTIQALGSIGNLVGLVWAPFLFSMKQNRAQFVTPFLSYFSGNQSSLTRKN